MFFTSTNSQNRFVALVAVLASISFAGCSPIVTAPPEQVVRQLADQRWQLLIAGDYAKAYEFTAPSYRAVVDLRTYQQKFAGGGVVWSAAKATKVVCQPEKCNVTVDVTGMALAGTTRLTRTVPVNEVWIFEANSWWQFDKL